MTHPGEHPVELVDLQGAWRRDGRTFSDDPLTEVADVLWLQVGRHFCDLRTPRPALSSASVLDQPQAFSGTVRVSGGTISFHHDLDSLRRDPAHPDEGTVHRQADVMFERGPGFEERWVMASLPGDDVGLAELADPGGAGPVARLILIGSVVLGVWGGRAPGGTQLARAGGWTTERILHGEGSPPELEAVAASLGAGGPLPTGWVAVDSEEV